MSLVRRLARTLRRAPAGRATVVALAAAVLVVQFALQSHLVEHELLSSAHEVCEQCVVAKSATPPAPMAAPSPAAARHAAPARPFVARAEDRTPLVVRSRAPPSLA